MKTGWITQFQSEQDENEMDPTLHWTYQKISKIKHKNISRTSIEDKDSDFSNDLYDDDHTI